MIDKVQKIREEVERLKSQLIKGACASQIAMETCCKEEAYNEVLTILDSLQEEPVNKQNLSNVQRTVKNWKEPVSEELEEAVNAYISNENNYSHSRTDTFKAGAEWQKEKMMKDATEAT